MLAEHFSPASVRARCFFIFSETGGSHSLAARRTWPNAPTGSAPHDSPGADCARRWAAEGVPVDRFFLTGVHRLCLGSGRPVQGSAMDLKVSQPLDETP